MTEQRGARGPDVSVRVAWADDAVAMAGVQVSAWRHRYVGVLPHAMLDALSQDEVAAAWTASLHRPLDARNRVLVALERNTVRGFVVTGPCFDDDCDAVVDGEMTELTVHPDHVRRGHGSRLLQAAADTLRADRFTRAVCWVNATDDVTRSFLTSAGWAADGAHRALDLHGDGTVTVKQVRLHTDLSDLSSA